MAVTDVIPQLRTTNLQESIDFYVSKLGFEFVFQYEDFYAGIRFGNYSIHLKLVVEPDPSIAYAAAERHLHLYFLTTDVDSEAERMKQHGVVFREEVADMPWGTREFIVIDNQGHVLCFGQPSAA